MRVATLVASKSDSATCPTGEPATGGGYILSDSPVGQTTATASGEQLYGGGWFASGHSISGFTPTWQITAVAVCGTR